MNKLKGVISIIGLVAKYGAVVLAIVKGLELVHDELKKIDFSDSAKPEPIKEVENE
ncbi:hypothetical protein CLU81_5324 [Flavobacterium sp. 9]|uniref:hypothetical protein n=1 Tax=Flavobacterium sp. 9 TaxID=2035198 RepID=UPI000C4793DE|nr:hypothetical protein [Flavobacterium sp. 9]PIF34663.1 hypothetical protein CLU81_5324 [Flavobacterium sp. 9]